MRRFARLYAELDETTSTAAKTAALARFFREAPPADAAWALAFLLGRRPKRLLAAAQLRRWGAEAAGIPEWLFEECYEAAGDLAETIALLVPAAERAEALGLAGWVEDRLLPLREADEAARREAVLAWWRETDERERLVLGKLLTGGFRVGVAAKLVTRAVAQASGVDEDAIAHRLMGAWEPSAAFYARLVAPDTRDADRSRPYPFCLAHPVEDDAAGLGSREAWLAEWKWDGIRAQLVKRDGRAWLWSRGEELLAGRFPEVEAGAALLPDGTVLDGELLPWRDEAPLPFAQLQRRIGRKTLTRRLLEEVPVRLLAFDLLEQGGEDRRSAPLDARRAALEALVAGLPPGAMIGASPLVDAPDWPSLRAAQREARACGAEGLMLKRREAPYGVGRRRGDWWKWKVTPYTVDAVLMYAQAGHGRRAGLYTDYTFGVWDGDTLVPIAKAYSGLTDEEIRRVDAFVRRHTLERFGPVRTVQPELVFELAFEGIQASPRHKSGIAVRFPRMLRWRTDKPPREADTLDAVRALLGRAGGGA